MNNISLVIITIILILLALYMCNCNERFVVDDSYTLGQNYQSGDGMIRGDLHIEPTPHSWFNSEYGPSGLTPGFMEEEEEPSLFKL